MTQNNKYIPSGYKDSPLGVIPQEWAVKRLGEICNESRLGGNYENAESNTGIPVIKMGNIGRGKIVLDKIQYLPSNECFNETDVLKSDDLLFNTRNTLELVGKVAIWKNELPFAIYNSNLLRLYFHEHYVHSNEFMNLSFNSYFSIKQLRGYATGTTSVAAIYSRDLLKMRFAVPPLEEQRRIAEVLGCWDEAIERQGRMVELLTTRKRALMQRLLTPQPHWQKIKAGNIFKNTSIKGCENEELLSSTQEYGIIPRNMLETRVTMPSGEIKSFKLVEKGNFVISLRSFQGGIEYSNYKGIVSPAYTVLTPKIQIDDVFYKYYFKSIEFISRLAVAVIGIRDGKQISYDDFCFIRIPNPPLTEQKSIAEKLSTADEEIGLARRHLDLLRTQKRALMQQLLTGKKRLKI